MMTLILLVVVVIALVMAAMAVGVIFGKRCLRGSCGGAEICDADGEPVGCEACPKRQAPEGETAAHAAR